MPKPLPYSSRPTTGLEGQAWQLPGFGPVKLIIAGASTANEADLAWAQGREPEQRTVAWRWSELLKYRHDRFAIVDASNRLLSLWCSEPNAPLVLPGQRAYRLDYVEVDPRHLGSSLGTFTMLTVYARALEVGADVLILGSLANSAGFYERLGGIKGRIPGWKTEIGLIPFTFAKATLLEGLEALNGLQD